MEIETLKTLLKIGKPVSLKIMITPKSNRDEITEISEQDKFIYLKIRIKALPEKGKANQALVKFLSKQFKIPQKNILIRSGHTSRQKHIVIHHDLQ